MNKFQFKQCVSIVLLMVVCALLSCGDEGDDTKEREGREQYESTVDSAFVNIGLNRADFDDVQVFDGTERQWLVALRKSDSHLLVSIYDKAHNRAELVNTDYVIAPSYKGLPDFFDTRNHLL